MGLHTQTQIYVGETPILAFKEFTLHQPIGDHNTFEIVCRLDVLDNDVGDLAAVTKEFLGEIATIQVSVVGFTGFSELRFKGVVTAIRNVKGYHLQGGDVVVIVGKSTSVITDDGPHMASFNDKNLSGIVNETFQQYEKGKLALTVNPKNNTSLHYCVQQQESSFQYVNRLSKQYGEWFYSDGERLIFGAPENGNEVTLRYGEDLKQFSFELAPQSSNYNYFTNDYITDKIHTKDTNGISTGVNGFNGFATKKANVLYAKQTDVYLNSYNDPESKQRLDSLVTLQKKAIEQKQVSIEGVSINPGLVLGALVKIENEKGSYGTFRISEITHTNNENGKYENNFRAISAESDAYPLTDISLFPQSQTQTAIVKENNDPEGMGRIKVQFPWQQKNGAMTPWVRIVTPHGGGDKGFHFIPELEEEVLIGFEGGNAECPYMVGSLYHKSKQPESWKTDANDIKAIRTRSGHTIELNDTDGAEFINITDAKGNLITIDTVGETITMNALKDININAGENINISAGQNIIVKAGTNLSQSAGENISSVASKDILLNASGNMTEMADSRKDIIDKDYSRQSATSDEYAKEVSIFSAEENMTLQSSKTVNINSAEKSKLF